MLHVSQIDSLFMPSSLSTILIHLTQTLFAMTLVSAAIGIGAEYTGKVAVADGKEVAATTLQCAAEAEALLAKAERVKAVSPLCVGVSATVSFMF